MACSSSWKKASPCIHSTTSSGKKAPVAIERISSAVGSSSRAGTGPPVNER